MSVTGPQQFLHALSFVMHVAQSTFMQGFIQGSLGQVGTGTFARNCLRDCVSRWLIETGDKPGMTCRVVWYSYMRLKVLAQCVHEYRAAVYNANVQVIGS